MDEQTMQTQPEQQFSEPQEPEYQADYEVPEEPAQPEDYNEVGEDEPEISLQDGEVKFSDDFFGDLKDEPEDNQQAPQASNYYTDEELQNTPYERWDLNRMPEEVRRYAQFLNAQTAARQQQYQYQQQIAQRPQTPPFIQEVKQYTPQELSKEAEKVAIERLGLKDPDDFDVYESEHAAALNIAMQELAQKRNEEIANYQQQTAGWQGLQQLNAEIASRPDFREYREWFRAKAQSEGTTPEQINENLSAYLKNGGSYQEAQKVIATFYQMFQNAKASKGNNNNSKGRQVQRRPQRPPVLEGTRGGSYEGKRSLNFRNFGEMDSDAQAQALMDIGIV